MKIVLSWSGGKDCAMALHCLRAQGLEVESLLTTLTEDYDRVSMHGVRIGLVEEQARAAGVSLRKLPIPASCSNEEYEKRMAREISLIKEDGVSAIAFADLFLEDLRAYREKRLAAAGMRALFPMWGHDTARLSRRFFDDGFRAVVTCVDTRALDESFSGREYDPGFLDDLPPGVDPCGENGEFHSFVREGPIFSRPIPVVIGERVIRDRYFAFTDLAGAGAAEIAYGADP